MLRDGRKAAIKLLTSVRSIQDPVEKSIAKAMIQTIWFYQLG